MRPLIIASHNADKVAEIKDLLAPLAINAIPAKELNLPEPEETGATFAENAILKARSAHQHSGKDALADDSGLCVEALGGDPGIYSARWAGPDKDFRTGIDRIKCALEEKSVTPTGAKAFFICVFALALGAGEIQTFEGRVYGTLTFPPRGLKGFGYDPIFIPEGGAQTFGEMDKGDKYALSHRTRAFEQLMGYLEAGAVKERA